VSISKNPPQAVRTILLKQRSVHRSPRPSWRSFTQSGRWVTGSLGTHDSVSALAILRLITSSYFTLIDPRSNDIIVRSPRRQAKNLSQRDICQIVQSLKIRAFKSARACIKQT
jgi:hypothetical protein